MGADSTTGLGYGEEQRDFVARHKLFFDRFPNLVRALETAFIRKGQECSLCDKVVFYLGRVCTEDFMEILLLCANGYGIGAMKLLRGLYERAVTAHYLHQNPDSSQDFWDFHMVAMHKELMAIEKTFGRKAVRQQNVDFIKAHFEKVRDRFVVPVCEKCGTTRLNHTWSKLDFVSMARKSGDLGDLIVPAYYEPLKQAHSTTASIISRLERKDDVVSFRCGAQRKEADMVLMTAHCAILNVLELQKEHFSLNALAEPLKQCVADLAEIWRRATKAQGQASQPKVPGISL